MGMVTASAKQGHGQQQQQLHVFFPVFSFSDPNCTTNPLWDPVLGSCHSWGAEGDRTRYNCGFPPVDILASSASSYSRHISVRPLKLWYIFPIPWRCLSRPWGSDLSATSPPFIPKGHFSPDFLDSSYFLPYPVIRSSLRADLPLQGGLQ